MMIKFRFNTYFAHLVKVAFIVSMFSCGTPSSALAKDGFRLVEEEKPVVSPFEKANFFLQKSSTSKIKGEIKGLEGNAPSGIKSKKDSSFFAIGFETPIYEKYLRYGFITSFITGAFFAIDLGFLAKASLPISLGQAGDIGVTATGQFGVSSFVGGNFSNRVFNKKFQQQEDFNPSSRVGHFTAFSFGIEYYPIEWVGISVESQSKTTNYLKDLDKKSKIEAVHKKPFSIKMNNVTVVGLKVTF